MKLKITNKWTSEIIELEGTSEELMAFMKEYKAQSYPWYVMNMPSVSSSTPCLLHDFDYNSTYPTCKRCGTAMATSPYPTITYGDPMPNGFTLKTGTSTTLLECSN